MSRLRVVLDTNCYISTLVFTGRLNRLRTGWEKRLFVQLVSKETMAELERVLSYDKFNVAPKRREELLDEVLFHADMFALSDPFAPVEGLRDPKDLGNPAEWVRSIRKSRKFDWLGEGKEKCVIDMLPCGAPPLSRLL